ncbi:Release factor glutamine methyltransferase [Rhynchospora pubera]|uniref:Release factor glutamine methyltransferase n=1 Tax=Rhynchospora pubera TaxID=906938 RepID=A0AAV8FEI5_9POAL|nr:Release factor glutamine methyltransferase [Rhynchospora pubera]
MLSSRFSPPHFLPFSSRHFVRPFSSLSPSPSPPQPPPTISPPPSSLPLPLFLRPLSHSTSLSSLLSFHHWAKAQSLSQPSLSSDLLRQLSWFLQDTTSPHPTHPSTALLRTELDELYSLWTQRVQKRKPFQYIVGCEHWRDLVLVVQDGVLIPRPETEILVDLVQEVEGFRDGVWVDLGTGSGALAVAIGKMMMDGGNAGRVLGIDISPTAVEVARFNVQRYGLEGKVEIRQGAWFEPLQGLKGKVTGIVSNPPYIPSSDLPGLQPEVGWYEPRLALDGGNDGTDHLLHICEGLAAVLKPGGFFAFETNGDKQSEFLANLLSTKWRQLFQKVKVVSDYYGVKRFVIGYRS